MSDEEIRIIELDPETAAALQRQHELDLADMGPKAPLSGFWHKGVRIESRCSVLAELKTMQRIVDALPQLMVRRIESIWCDSKCGSNYVVGVRSGGWAPNLRDAVSEAVMAVNGGHNGIVIEEDGTRLEDIDPDWDEVVST